MKQTLDKVTKGMVGWDLHLFCKADQKELKSLPDVTKMTANELKKEFWDIQTRFDTRMTVEEAEGAVGVLLMFRQQLLDQFFHKLTNETLI
jgi:hypothetical protein